MADSLLGLKLDLPLRSICSYVMMMPFKRQALVEFDSMDGAECCVASEAILVAHQRAFFNFSTSKRITRPTNADDPTGGNKVLLLSVQNPLYPITTVSPLRDHWDTLTLRLIPPREACEETHFTAVVSFSGCSLRCLQPSRQRATNRHLQAQRHPGHGGIS